MATRLGSAVGSADMAAKAAAQTLVSVYVLIVYVKTVVVRLTVAVDDVVIVSRGGYEVTVCVFALLARLVTEEDRRVVESRSVIVALTTDVGVWVTLRVMVGITVDVTCSPTSRCKTRLAEKLVLLPLLSRRTRVQSPEYIWFF